MSQIALGDRMAAWGRPVRLIVTWAVPVVLVGLVLWHWSSVNAGTEALRHVGWRWSAAAAATVIVSWVAGAFCQLGATTERLPVVRVFATQVAGDFVNHVLPAGTGLWAVNLRMLRRSGLSPGGALGAVSLNAAAGFVLRVLALVALLAVQPGIVHLPRHDVLGAAGMVLSLAAAAALVCWFGRRRWRLAERTRTTATALWEVLRRPDRAVMLWAGSAAVPALHILTLALVLHGLGAPTPLATIAIAYLAAAAIGTVVPSPGGLGAFDVTLLAGLTSTGLTTPVALAGVIGYRLLTVWIPLVPGAAILVFLLRRRLI